MEEITLKEDSIYLPTETPDWGNDATGTAFLDRVPRTKPELACDKASALESEQEIIELIPRVRIELLTEGTRFRGLGKIEIEGETIRAAAHKNGQCASRF